MMKQRSNQPKHCESTNMFAPVPMRVSRRFQQPYTLGACGVGRPPRTTRRKGSIIPLTAITLVALCGFLALTLDLGFFMVKKTELQVAADASALACAGEMMWQSEVEAKDTAISFAEFNAPDAGEVLQVGDVIYGNWDTETRFFVANSPEVNAVQVTLRRSNERDNLVSNFFSRIWGHGAIEMNVQATALAHLKQFRFLIDDEVIDTDVPAIENLAERYGVTPDELLSDADGDWFIDLPVGEIIELPTGQVGDSGLFDRNHPDFPFGEPDNPSMYDFLRYNENGGDVSKGGIDFPDCKALMDPLLGVSAVENPELYPSYVSQKFVHVSPIFMSDVDALNPQNSVPCVNALGLRRGLLAFKIIAVGDDPEGSVLPTITIEIVDPSTIDLSHLEERPNILLVQ